MKTTGNYVRTGLLLLITVTFMNLAHPENRAEAQTQIVQKAVKINCPDELRPLLVQWGEAYKLTHPEIELLVRKSDPGEFSDDLVISGQYPDNTNFSWSMVLGREAVVPVTSVSNPFKDQLEGKGLSIGQISGILNGNTCDWKAAGVGGKPDPILVLISGGNSVVQMLNEIAGKTSVFAAVPGAIQVQDLRSAMLKHPLSLGFCSLSDISHAGATFPEGMMVIPVDKNSNGRIDSFEKIYESPASLQRGIWIGKYPAQLSRPLLVYAKARPESEEAVAFLSWVMNEGQHYLPAFGFIELTGAETLANLHSLKNTADEAQLAETGNILSTGWLILIFSLVVIGVITALIVSMRRNYKTSPPEPVLSLSPSLEEKKLTLPGGVFFDRTHTWAFMEKAGFVKVGVDDFLQHVTGKFSKLHLKDPGERVNRGEVLVTLIKDGKQLRLYSPVSGTVTEVNNGVVKDAGLVNMSPLQDGWLYRIRPFNWTREVQFLMLGDQVHEWVQNEFSRLKDFISGTVNRDARVYQQVVMQDGGEITDHVLSELSPEIWEDFQEQFIDVSR